MGVDWDAHLSFGYELGFKDDFIEWDNQPAWYDEEKEDGIEDQMLDFLLKEVVGFTETWETSIDDKFWERRRDAESRLGVEFTYFCSLYERDSVGYILSTKTYRSSEDQVSEIRAEDLVVDPRWIKRLDRAISALGIKPKNDKPTWLLSTLMS